jgi:hypothetical protein
MKALIIDFKAHKKIQRSKYRNFTKYHLWFLTVTIQRNHTFWDFIEAEHNRYNNYIS